MSLYFLMRSCLRTSWLRRFSNFCNWSSLFRSMPGRALIWFRATSSCFCNSRTCEMENFSFVMKNLGSHQNFCLPFDCTLDCVLLRFRFDPFQCCMEDRKKDKFNQNYCFWKVKQWFCDVAINFWRAVIFLSQWK